MGIYMGATRSSDMEPAQCGQYGMFECVSVALENSYTYAHCVRAAM